MSATSDAPGADEVIRVDYERQRQAMVEGVADALDALLADRFTLAHMTGYLQSK